MSVELLPLLSTLIAEKASDVHVRAGIPPKLRKFGKLVSCNAPVVTVENAASIVREAFAASGGGELHSVALNQRGSADFSIEFRSARFRVNVCRTRAGDALVARRLPNRLLTMDEIGVPAAIRQAVDSKDGLVLVTGVTGSGKSTTLASIGAVMASRGYHLVTIEHPVEYKIPPGSGVVTSREVGMDVPDFRSGLVDALRQDPDVIIVGEMRDLDTMRTAIEAAETGHVVLGTLHTRSAANAVNRILMSFPENEQPQVRTQLSTVLKGVLCQRLIPRDDEEGQVAAFEVMVNNSAIANLIRENKPWGIESAIQTGRKDGMWLMDEHLFRLWKDGQISKSDALDNANNQGVLAGNIAKVEAARED